MLVTHRAQSSQREMCPKHGIPHGVCVDPIKAKIPTEEDLQVGGLGYSALEIHDEGKATNRFEPHLCALCETIHVLPRLGEPSRCPTNRFDPFEALGEIHIEAQSAPESSYQAICKQVLALRAYITGMGK